MAEAVTSRVSALPTVGSDFQTGLSTAVGREDRCSLSSGDYSDKVGHVAGRSEARTVPVEHWSFFSTVYNVMPSWIRPMVVQTSEFFLSDEREAVDMPLCEENDRPVRPRKLYIHDVDTGAQMTKETHGVGPTGDRWDGLGMMDTWYMECIGRRTQLGDTERLLRGSPCSDDFGKETGPVSRNGQSVLNLDWLDGHPNRRGGSVKTGTEATIVQYGRDIKGLLSKDGTLSDRPAVWKYATVYPLRLVICLDRTLTVLYCGVVFKLLSGRLGMSSGSFLKSVSESSLDKLYDLPDSIQDVMGLQALRPSAAVCKVMTIPDSNCIRIVTPDEHVPTGFHEILLYDMGLEEWPKVPLSDIGCLRLDWPKELFNFVGRYQLELEQMRKECRDRFEGISSGACPTCEKFIQVNLGRHVALYHLDLAQLWRCPVGWCPVWKGTSQDCIDHMRRAHNTPTSVKAGNLARWFPPWTVTREQWHSMSRPSVSGIAIDTFLFSRIGAPLFHRYRVFDRLGSHPAFRKPYMPKLFLFLKESDSETIRRSHRRRAKEIATGMTRQASVARNVVSETILSGPAPQRTVVSKLTGRNAGKSLVPPAGGTTGSAVGPIDGRSREEDTVQALMDLSLPRFARFEDGGLPKTRLWPITEHPPSSPASVGGDNQSRTPSPCYQLDDVSSASSIGETTTNDYNLTLPTESAHSITPVGSIVISSDDDVPLRFGQEDRRKVQRRDVVEDGLPGPNEVLEYVPIPRKKPVDIPIYTPTPRDRPVEVPIMRERPADDRMFDPILGEWPVEDRVCEAKTLIRPTGGQILRASPVETLVYKPIPRERPSGEKPYGLRPREKQVEVPKLKGRPVDGWEYEPLHRVRPAGYKAKDVVSEERPVGNQKPMGKLMDLQTQEPKSGAMPGKDEAYEPMPRNGPIAILGSAIGPVKPMMYEVTPRDEGNDNQSNERRPADDETSVPTPDGRPDTGPRTIIRPKGGEAETEAVSLLREAPPPSEVPDWSDGEAMPLIIIDNNSEMPVPTKTNEGLLTDSDNLLPKSHEVNSSGDQGVLSAPISPNRVRKGHSQDMPAEGSLFDVSPDIPGFHMRPAGGVVQQADTTPPPPPNYVGFNNPFFGSPIAFAQCQGTSGMDTTTTLPVYSIPKDSSIGIDQSAVPTVYASGVSPDAIPWSTAEDIIRDIVREGPFDVDTTPMDTEDSPLINTSMPGCPYRMTSYTGTATVDADTRYGLQLHHPRFLEFIGAPESARLLNQSPSFWVDRLGQESAMAAAVNLQRDAGFMMSNLQILGQFVTSLHRMSAEMLSIGVDHVVFPVEEVDRLSVMPRAQRAAKYMTAMGLWRPPSGPGAAGPLPASTCTSCMNCEYCFGRKGPKTQ